jgi:hypothetical protein
MKSFDLNIERVLEDWDVSDAVREIIANAIDDDVRRGRPARHRREEPND